MTRDTYRQSKIPSSFYKVVIFTVVTVFTIGVLATLIGNISFVPSRTYSAVFTDATGVFVGDRVRVSGVEVGSIKSIEMASDGDRKLAKLEFSVEDSVPMYRDAQLQLRYENIVGQRYLAIVEKPGSKPEMPAGETFPVGQTMPALNLTVLFNGFQPLFRALDPDQINTLSFELVRALQGESANLRSLMQDTAQLTNALADKEQVIGSVVTNLNTVLATVDTRDQKLTALIVRFRDLMTGLAEDRDVISAQLPDLASLLDGTSSLLREVRGPLATDIRALGKVAGQLAATRGELDASLKRLPLELRTQARTGSYGSFFNFYTCGIDIQLQLLGGTAILRSPSFASNERDTVCGAGDQP
jgi:phospholipid/cholesterol/gamma-HCH transport system substrate-binding protein